MHERAGARLRIWVVSGELGKSGEGGGQTMAAQQMAARGQGKSWAGRPWEVLQSGSVVKIGRGKRRRKENGRGAVEMGRLCSAKDISG